MPGGIEAELKLDLDPGTWRAIREGWGRDLPAAVQENAFYDTPGRDLERGGWAVRVRLEGTRAWLTVKGAPTVAADGVFQRPELECDLPPAAARAMAEGFGLAGVDLPPARHLAGLFGDLRLERCLRFTNERTRIPWHGLVLELDRMEAGGQVFHELEAETAPDRLPAVRAELEAEFRRNGWAFRPGTRTKMTKAREACGRPPAACGGGRPSHPAMRQFQARVLANRSITEGFHEMTFSWDAPDPAPGAFFTLRTGAGMDPLLRRPFAVSGFDATRRSAACIYQRRGKATASLSALEGGDQIDVIGPLGRPFPAPEAGARPVLVAGGIGLGPVLFLARALAARGEAFLLVAGFRDASRVPEASVFAGLSPVICTDDGSAGRRGTALAALRALPAAELAGRPIYACGPHPLLAGCHGLALETGGACFVSVEQIMACGVGACMGCAVRLAAGGFARACTEGPVFASRSLAWT